MLQSTYVMIFYVEHLSGVCMKLYALHSIVCFAGSCRSPSAAATIAESYYILCSDFAGSRGVSESLYAL